MPAAIQHSANWRSLLARPGFRYFFAGMMISLFGSGMNFASVTWFILAQTGSTVDVSIMLILATLPGLLVPVVGGVLIDRVDRRYLAITLDLARFGAVGGVAALIAFAHQGLLLIYTMVLFNGFCSAIYWATINALVQEVVGAEELVGANSALVIAVQCGWLMAGALVGFFYDRAGIAGILLIDSCTYAASACCLYKLRRGYFHPRATAPDQARAGMDAPLAMAEETALPPIVEALPDPGFLHELKDGIRYLRSQPSVMALGFTYAAMLAGVFSANVLVVALAKDVLHSGARGFGALEFGWGFGALIGGLAVGALDAAHHNRARVGDSAGHSGFRPLIFSVRAHFARSRGDASGVRRLQGDDRYHHAIFHHDHGAEIFDGAHAIVDHRFCHHAANDDELRAGLARRAHGTGCGVRGAFWRLCGGAGDGLARTWTDYRSARRIRRRLRLRRGALLLNSVSRCAPLAA